MDIRRIILWVTLSFSIFLLLNSWQKQKIQEESLQSNSSVPYNSKSTISALSVPNGFSSSVGNISSFTKKETYRDSEIFSVDTDVLRLFFDSNGAQIVRAELLQFLDKKNRNHPTVLLDRSADLFYVVQSGIVNRTKDLKFPNHLTPFQLVSKEFKLSGDNLDVVFEAELNGCKVQKVFSLHRGKYDIEVGHVITNENETEILPSLYLQIERDENAPPGTSSLYSTFHGVAIYSKENKFQKVTFSDVKKNKANYIQNTHSGWIAFVQHYFATAWIPNDESERRNEVLITDKNKDLFAVRTIENLGPIPPKSYIRKDSRLWIGPQDQRSMAQVATGLELVVDYGFLTIIAKPLFTLMTFLHKLIGNWGWTIVLLTILIKGLFFPLASASYRSMERMKRIAPRIQLLKEKYGDDKQKFNSAMIEMYRNEKINPFGGCLPMLLQIPVFISLYWVLLASVEMHGAPWIFWISDLSARDPLFILPAAMIGTMFLQIKLNPKPPDPIQAKVMMIMPLLFGGMMFIFPSGLVLYWCVNNILSISQQWFIMQRLRS